MVSRSSDKTESARMTAAESDAARRELDAAKWTAGDFIRAAFVAVAAKPAEVLALLGPYRREQKTAGRPRKGGQVTEDPPASS